MQEVTRDGFASEVLQAEQPVFVDFWGPQCGPCLKLMPAVEKIAQQFDGRLKVVKIEAPKNRRLCIELRVLSLPTYLGFVGGKEVARLTGSVSAQQLRALARDLAKGTSLLAQL